jgi:hypothetical protein
MKLIWKAKLFCLNSFPLIYQIIVFTNEDHLINRTLIYKLSENVLHSCINSIQFIFKFYVIVCPILLLPSASSLLHLLSDSVHLDFCIKQVSICCSFYGMGQVGPVNGMMTMGANKPQSTPVSSTTSKSAKEYDFSSLTQGMFAKQWLVCWTLLAAM